MDHLFEVVRAGLVVAVVFVGGRGGPAAAAESEAVPAPSRAAAAGPAGELARDTPPRLRLTWIDVLGSAPFAFESATQEASAILAGAGVETAWTRGEAASVTTEDELKIVLMPGIANGARLPERAMGGTRRDAQSRTIWVYASNVLWALGLLGSGRSFTALEEADIACALGRVAAHEIVHAVAPELPHSRTGLMAGRIGRAALVGGVVSLAPREQQALRAGVERFAAPAERSPDVVARAARR